MAFKLNPMTGQLQMLPDTFGWVAQVNTYNDLPTANDANASQVYLVLNSSGIWPFKKAAGFWQSTGVAWKWLGYNSLAAMSDVDVTGIQAGQTLVYDGANSAFRGGDISADHVTDTATRVMISPAEKAAIATSSGSGKTPVDFSLGYVAITGAVTLDSTAYGRAHSVSGTSADYTITLPAPSPGKAIHFTILGTAAASKLYTLDCGAGNNINGSQTKKMHAGESCTLVAADSNTWLKADGRSIPMTCCIISNINQIPAVSTHAVMNYNLAGILVGPVAMQDTSTYKVTILRPGVYKLTHTFVPMNTNTTAHMITIRVTKNGSLVGISSTSNIGASSYLVFSCQTIENLVAGDVIQATAFYSAGTYVTSFPALTKANLLVEELAPW